MQVMDQCIDATGNIIYYIYKTKKLRNKSSPPRKILASNITRVNQEQRFVISFERFYINNTRTNRIQPHAIYRTKQKFRSRKRIISSTKRDCRKRFTQKNIQQPRGVKYLLLVNKFGYKKDESFFRQYEVVCNYLIWNC